ncbi:MAG TPA: insulinase family protein, partial [Nitriliruptorales bacterium]
MIELAPRPTPTDPLPFVPPVPVVQVHDGVRLVAVDVPGDGFVDVRLLWSRGWAHEPDELDGITELTARLVGNATEELDPYALACAAESIGASLRASVGSESFTLAVDVVRDGLEPAVDLLLDSLRRPDLSDAHVDRVRTEAVDARRRHLADPVRL